MRISLLDLTRASAASRLLLLFVLRTSFIYSVVMTDQLDQLARVGQERFELSTPRLSSVCSNQLSYWPVGLIGLSRPNSKSIRCESSIVDELISRRASVHDD